MMRDYIEITRLFNMGLTGVAPVLGALSMWDIGKVSVWELFVLFIIGVLAHVYGFVLNDVVDIKVDKLSKELTARPLVRGTISKRRAFVFAVSCMVSSFVLSVIFYSNLGQYLFLIFIMALAFLFATIYNVASKKYPGMDIFVAGAMFFGIIFGASTIDTPSYLAWIVAFIGGIQVLFMNMINGAIKDIDHDREGNANTIAIRLGARVQAGIITLPLSFKTTGYLIEIGRTLLVFAPFVFLGLEPRIWQLSLLGIIFVLTLYLIHKIYSITTFQRNRIRRRIGMVVILMYASTPVMLSSLNIYFLLLALVPPLWFIFSNLLLYKTVFEPKTM